jgi:type II secretory pathway component PulK
MAKSKRGSKSTETYPYPWERAENDNSANSGYVLFFVLWTIVLLSLVLLTFTKNLSFNAQLEGATLQNIKESYNLRGACLIAVQKLPVVAQAPKQQAAPQTGQQTSPPRQQSGQPAPSPLQTMPQGLQSQQITEGFEEEFAEEIEGGLEEEEFLDEEEFLEEEIMDEGGFEGEEEFEESEETGMAGEEDTGEEDIPEEEAKKEHWRARLEPYTVDLRGKEYSIFIEDEGGKLNVNSLDESKKDVFKRLLLVRGVSESEVEAIIDSLIDWLDSNDQTQPRGAENRYYESLPEPYPCRNGPMANLEELILVKGVTPDIYDNIKKDLTIYTKEFIINLNSASKEVIHAALGITLQEADEVVALVKEKKEIKNIDEVKDLFFKFGVAGRDFEKVRNLLTVASSPYFSIRSVGNTGRQYSLVIDKSNENILAVYPE